MPHQPLSLAEIEGIDLLIKTAHELLSHTYIVAVAPVPDATTTAEKLLITWKFVYTFLQQHPTRPAPTREMASKLIIATLSAAKVLNNLPTRLQNQWIRLQYMGSAMPSKTSELLQELAIRMKDFKR